MKRIICLCAVVLLPLLMQAQQMMSELSITINGNKNLQMTLDGKVYDLKSVTPSGNVTSFSMNNIPLGQHSFLFTRTDISTDITDKIAATIHLRYGYDMTLVLNEDGSLELIESRKKGFVSVNQQPMGGTPFNSLLQQVKGQTSTAKRKDIAAAAFAKPGNYFTTSQVEQLLKLINAESFRLSLAKSAFARVTDPYNFGSIYSLLNTEASKKNLNEYISHFERKAIPSGAMSDADFRTLYQTIQQQWPVSTQMSSLTSAFSNANNYFTTYQAAQLIQLVSAENDRLKLAKTSYRSITDKANFVQIYDLLNLQSSRNELQDYVQGQGGYNSGGAMNEANFNNLYTTIRQQWPVSTQMNSLNEAFSNANNYFTSYQAVQLIKLVTAETNRLQLAKASYRSIIDKDNFNQVYDVLNMQSSRNELQEFVRSQSGSNTGNAMNETNFNNLYNTIQQQWPVSTQMNSLSEAFSNTNNYFTTNQAVQLIKLVSAESNRLQLAKASYRSITDKGNFNQVYNLLNTQSSRNELAEYVRNYGTADVNTNTQQPMSDANFDNLYQKLQLQFMPFEKMNSISEVFSNTSDYFTTAQAKQLIQLVTMESNRLSLAKMSYRKITDRNNFNQMYDVFSSQASKDELAEYVRSYKD